MRRTHSDGANERGLRTRRRTPFQRALSPNLFLDARPPSSKPHDCFVIFFPRPFPPSLLLPIGFPSTICREVKRRSAQLVPPAIDSRIAPQSRISSLRTRGNTNEIYKLLLIEQLKTTREFTQRSLPAHLHLTDSMAVQNHGNRLQLPVCY